MISKSSFDSLSIEGKNSIKDNAGYSIANSSNPNFEVEGLSNLVLNSNLETGEIIK